MARRRRAVLPRAPWEVSTKLHATQIRDLQMAHNVNLDDLNSGRAGPEVMWQTMGGVLTWLRVAERLQQGVPEMQTQHELLCRVIARYVRTGAVHFAAGEYDLARQGVMAMDLLAELVDRPTAIAAANWAEVKCKAMQANTQRGAALA